MVLDYKNLSYWEIKQWFSNIDYLILGAGIVGFSTAWFLKEKYPESNILIIDKSFLPNGASTKNAGFACFGSLSEILSDIDNSDEHEVFELVKKRYDGLTLLRKILDDKGIEYVNHGGFEIFSQEHQYLLEKCTNNIEKVNKLLFPIFNSPTFSFIENNFNFKKIDPTIVRNKFEGQLDTGKMMGTFWKKIHSLGVNILMGIDIQKLDEDVSDVKVHLSQDFYFRAKKVLITTNAFAKPWVNEDIIPARSQVLITSPIDNLPFRGTFHLDEGFYYFRNIDNRILLGGGRNLDFEGESTLNFGTTSLIQNKLENLLEHIIFTSKHLKIDYRWSGIMAMGKTKKPIIKPISRHIFCGVRLGGMGVAIGTMVGKELSQMVVDS